MNEAEPRAEPATACRRRITHSEARHLALDAIRHAEERRARFAEEEAVRALTIEAEV